jgi:hypothetical protein
MPPWMHQGPSSRARGRRPAMDPQNPSLPSPGLGFVVGLQIYASTRERGMGWLRGSGRAASRDRRDRPATVAGGNGDGGEEEVGTGTGTGMGTGPTRVWEDELVQVKKREVFLQKRRRAAYFGMEGVICLASSAYKWLLFFHVCHLSFVVAWL